MLITKLDGYGCKRAQVRRNRSFFEQAKEIWEELVVGALSYSEFQKNLNWFRSRLKRLE